MTSAEQTSLVATTSLGVSYGATRILRDIDFELSPQTQLALTGRSGSGKTTLLLVLAGLVAPSHGTVTWPGLATKASERRGQIGMVFQAPSLMPELTALENVALPLRLRGASTRDAAHASLSALEQVSAVDLAAALPTQLSGGQQQRVGIARVLAGKHRLVLADEPTGALDRAHALEATDALRNGVAAAGGALIFATHDLALAELFEHEAALLDGSLRDSVTSR